MLRYLLLVPGLLLHTVTRTPEQQRRPRPSLGIAPRTVQVGDSALLTWSVVGIDTVYISQLGHVPASGSRWVSPRRSTVYTLVAESNGVALTKSAKLTVSGSRGGSDFPSAGERFYSPLSCDGTLKPLHALQNRILTVLQNRYSLSVQEWSLARGAQYVFLTTKGERADLLDKNDPTIGARRVAFRITLQTASIRGAFHYTIESLIESKKRLINRWKVEESQAMSIREAQRLRDRINGGR